MVKDVQSILSENIEHILKEYLPSVNKKDYPRINLEFPKDKNHGDISCNISYILARQLKRTPVDISNEFRAKLQEQIAKSKIKQDIEKIESVGGFINIFLNRNYLYDSLSLILRYKDNFFLQTNIGKKKSVNIEFVSANPTGPLSVAHARQAAAGDSLANILKTLGFSVKKEYYLNDEGRQINLLGQSLYARFRELKGEKIEFPEEGYQGDYIIDIAKQIKQDKGLEFFKQYGLEYILNVIRKELEDFGVKFDVWRSQKWIREKGRIKKVLAYLKKKKLVYEKDGALWFKSTQFGDDKDRVVVKSDGTYTYLAPDIAYHQDKFRRNFKWLINLWGPDHHGYIPRLKAAVQALGYPKDALSVIIVQLATLYKAKEVLAMSTRKGQYIMLRQVLDEVGMDAARFFFLMRKTDSHLDFDLELAKKHSLENPVYYIQYAHARIVNILKNTKVKKANLYFLREEEEIKLLKCLVESKEVLLSCYKVLDSYPIIGYLQELAALVHRFYDKHRVLGQEKELMRARIALLEGARIVILNFLKILGVSTPEKMQRAEKLDYTKTRY